MATATTNSSSARRTNEYRIYVDAFQAAMVAACGLITRAEISFRPFGGSLLPLRWWQAGADGWPIWLSLAAAANFSWRETLVGHSGCLQWPSHAHAQRFRAAGNRRSQWRRASGPVSTLPDLNEPSQPYAAGKLLAIKGTPPEAWRMLSNYSFIPVAGFKWRWVWGPGSS